MKGLELIVHRETMGPKPARVGFREYSSKFDFDHCPELKEIGFYSKSS